jgi:hypothetical protein
VTRIRLGYSTRRDLDDEEKRQLSGICQRYKYGDVENVRPLRPAPEDDLTESRLLRFDESEFVFDQLSWLEL